ncbi:hypothetical protein GLAREA_12731 [Glarea lozoyensis ATCC 20868]|uniref:Uncharacterized protein n=1 Tax=Glarea lozoyensis (strain ATCC 20868 / MF5171) TaxID=1116229 RepID=S3DYJ5_GLAL2|nr:uncharacterized protein GLAREA_12731 [Glarea lozoyensis ATCC 20868]EPE31428.1 hypothetical protein GLAREA_12731 [Glarea lozoyensis ATCC 20868]
MSLPDRTKYGETISSPAKLTDRQLFTMPLREFSKSISLTTSFSTTADVYLRWLEVHRVRRSEFTEHWENTIIHWVQSLRARGFKEGDLINEIRIWKERSGPLIEVYGRQPPGSRDVEKAYDRPLNKNQLPHANSMEGDPRRRENPRDLFELPYDDDTEELQRVRNESRLEKSYEIYKSSSKKKTMENFAGPPPPSYVCNRCGKKGMFHFT